MEFPKGVEFLLDWSPSGSLGYREFLERKNCGDSIRLAAPEKLLKLVGAFAQIQTLGISHDVSEVRLPFILLIRDISELKHCGAQGGEGPSSLLRWGLCEMAIGLPRLYRTPQDTPSWAEEHFANARNQYQRGDYAHALEIVSDAIADGERQTRPKEDSRLLFLLGRLRIGCWYGKHKNASSALIDPAKAEEAFLAASKAMRREQIGGHDEEAKPEEESAIALLWAGRAAFCAEKFSRAIGHINQAAALISPENTVLAAAAQHLLARSHAGAGAAADKMALREALKQCFAFDPRLAIEAISDPLILHHSEALCTALEAATKDIKSEHQDEEEQIQACLAKLRRFSYDGVAATTLLRNESEELKLACMALEHLNDSGGLLDMAEAGRIVCQTAPLLADLFDSYKTRFAHERWHKWEGLLVTKAAKDADAVVKTARAAHAAADEVYRKNGGYDRAGGSEKILYALVCLVLAFYMFYVNLHWQTNSYPLAALFFIGAGWLMVSYFRRKWGLVEGYNKLRLTKMILAAAELDAERKESIAARTWLSYQKGIDALGKIDPPF